MALGAAEPAAPRQRPRTRLGTPAVAETRRFEISAPGRYLKHREFDVDQRVWLRPADLVTRNRRVAESALRPLTPVFAHGDLQITPRGDPPGVESRRLWRTASGVSRVVGLVGRESLDGEADVA
jgi:hypothetical protein